MLQITGPQLSFVFCSVREVEQTKTQRACAIFGYPDSESYYYGWISARSQTPIFIEEDAIRSHESMVNHRCV